MRLPIPAKGPSSLAPSLRSGLPLKGELPLQNPQGESHPLRFTISSATVSASVEIFSSHRDSGGQNPNTTLSLRSHSALG